MPDAASESQLEFPINQTLLEDATRVREEWRIMKDRLLKIDQSKGQVSAEVYARVRKDYESKLNDATINMKKKKEAVDRELVSLEQTRKKIEAQLTEHKQRLEEFKFRNTLGEFDDNEYQDVSRTEQDKIAKFESVINAVENNISRYQSIFSEDTEAFSSAKKPAPTKSDEIKLTVPLPESEPLTDAQGFLIEEEEPDYFSTPEHSTHEEETNPTIEESPEAKSTIDLRPKYARVVIINGADAGTTYPLKGIVTIGRAESNTIVLKDVKVSRQHAQISQQGTEFMVIDLNSSNGTYVNNQRVEEHVLSNGDEILIGDFVLQFQM